MLLFEIQCQYFVQSQSGCTDCEGVFKLTCYLGSWMCTVDHKAGWLINRLSASQVTPQLTQLRQSQWSVTTIMMLLQEIMLLSGWSRAAQHTTLQICTTSALGYSIAAWCHLHLTTSLFISRSCLLVSVESPTCLFLSLCGVSVFTDGLDRLTYTHTQ